MHYDDTAYWRPLFETNMVQLQVARGCSYNRCRFCNMYHQPFALSPFEEVEADVAEIASALTYVPRVFLTGGNALALPFDMLERVLTLVNTALAPANGTGCFARIDDVARKSDDELLALARLGLSDISIGAETGYEPALDFMRKGYSADDIVAQSDRLDKAGIAYDFFYLAGMAGKGRCEEAAKASAELFDRTHPKRIMIHTMTIFRGTQLKADVESGAFDPAGEIEVLKDMRAFIAHLETETYILGNHYANTVRVCGGLPDARAEMLEELDYAIENANEEAFQAFRRSVKSI